LREIKDDAELFDVSIVCEDNDKHVEAHKLILSACSPFFRAVIKKLKHSHPLLYLRGVTHKNLVSIMSFLYNGEVNVCQDDLNSFLAAAEDLKIKGLTQNQDKREDPGKNSPVHRSIESKENHAKNSPIFSSKSSMGKHSKRLQNEKNLENDDVDEITDVQPIVPVKVEPQIIDNIIIENSNDDFGEHTLHDDDYGEALHYEGANELFHSSGSGFTLDSANKDIFEALTENLVEIIQDPEKGKLWSCKQCGKLVKNRNNLQHHVESSHIPPQQNRYTCTYCGIKKFTYKALEKHHYKDHRDYVLSKTSYIAQ